jgi:hypothetical protein
MKLWTCICCAVCSTVYPAEQGYYGPPPCRSDERAFEGVGLKGRACAANCSTYKDCPTTRVFENATAKPDCESGFCVLVCGEGIGKCAKKATCDELAPGLGVCLFPDPV